MLPRLRIVSGTLRGSIAECMPEVYASRKLGGAQWLEQRDLLFYIFSC
jgi:hypothetical protein